MKTLMCDLDLQAPVKVKVNVPFTCTLTFANSMPVHLTHCSWLIEGPGIQKAKSIPQA